MACRTHRNDSQKQGSAKRHADAHARTIRSEEHARRRHRHAEELKDARGRVDDLVDRRKDGRGQHRQEEHKHDEVDVVRAKDISLNSRLGCDARLLRKDSQDDWQKTHENREQNDRQQALDNS